MIAREKLLSWRVCMSHDHSYVITCVCVGLVIELVKCDIAISMKVCMWNDMNCHDFDYVF